MTKKHSFLLLLFASFLFNSCHPKVPTVSSYPPNTKPLVNGKFLDVSYIECLHILEFLIELRKDANSRALLQKVTPKSDIHSYNGVKVDYTIVESRAIPFPVNKEFAIEYCKWRGEVVTNVVNFGIKQNYKLTYSEMVKRNKKAKVVIKYSIPTIQDLQTPYRNKTGFKKYDKKFLIYDVLSQETKDLKKLCFLRCIATVER